jgi:hypothetical protein
MSTLMWQASFTKKEPRLGATTFSIMALTATTLITFDLTATDSKNTESHNAEKCSFIVTLSVVLTSTL